MIKRGEKVDGPPRGVGAVAGSYVGYVRGYVRQLAATNVDVN